MVAARTATTFFAYIQNNRLSVRRLSSKVFGERLGNFGQRHVDFAAFGVESVDFQEAIAFHTLKLGAANFEGLASLGRSEQVANGRTNSSGLAWRY